MNRKEMKTALRESLKSPRLRAKSSSSRVGVDVSTVDVTLRAPRRECVRPSAVAVAGGRWGAAICDIGARCWS